jgi:hypothetical protein
MNTIAETSRLGALNDKQKDRKMKALRKLSGQNIGKGFLTLANGSCGIVDYEIKMRPSGSVGIGWITASDELLDMATRVGRGRLRLSSELTLVIVIGLKVRSRTSITITSVSNRTNLYCVKRIMGCPDYGDDRRLSFHFSDEHGGIYSSGSRLTFESGKGFPIDWMHASLAHAHWNFHYSQAR